MVILDGEAEILHKAGDGLGDHDHVLHREDPTPIGAQRGLLGECQGLDRGLQEGQAVAIALDLLALERLNDVVFFWVVHLFFISRNTIASARAAGGVSEQPTKGKEKKGEKRPRRFPQCLQWTNGNKVRKETP